MRGGGFRLRRWHNRSPASGTTHATPTTFGLKLERMQRHDRNLTDQLKRAASSVVLNLAEAAYNNAGHRRSRLESARGSANEARAAVSLAAAWGYISEQEAAAIDALYDRVLAMTYRLWARA